MGDRSPYDILGIPESADEADIRAAYLRRAKILHPDRFDKACQPEEWAMANGMQTELNTAYEAIRNCPRAAPSQHIAEATPFHESVSDQQLISQGFECIRRERVASTSILQSKLQVSYNRAAYIIDYLVQMGVLAHGSLSESRKILVDLETLQLPFAKNPNGADLYIEPNAPVPTQLPVQREKPGKQLPPLE